MFGDPFQGAPINGYRGPIKTYCKPTDGVCGGNFEIGASHLSYGGGDTTQAIADMKRFAAGGRMR